MEAIARRWAGTLFAIFAVGALAGCQAVQNSSSASTPPPSGSVTLAKASLDFGTVTVGQSATSTDTITNGTSGSVSIAQPTVTGADFSITSPSFPVNLAAGQSASIQLTFTPATSGSQTGSVALSGGGQTFTIALTGKATTAGKLSGSPSALSFGSVQVGKNSTISETVTNTGTGSLTISQANLSGSSAFTISGLTLPTTLNANQSATISVKFAPSAAGSATGTLAIVSDGSNSPFNLALSGTAVTPGTMSANPASLTFGNVATGSTKTLSEVLSNSGGSALTISSITPSGTGFSISGVNPPATLSPGQTVTFSVTFAPTANGSATGSLAIASNGSNPSLSVSLSGTGATPGQLAVTPTTMNFGNVVVGLTQSQSGTLTATGASVTVSSIGTTSSEFSVSGVTLPFTINAGSTASFTATFRPSASGAASGTLSFASNASNTPAALAVSGSGTPPPQHSVTLNWSPSSSSNVVGYNVYRGSQTGGPYSKLNSALDANTTDTDLSVAGGQTYYYVVTAVDSTGLESGYSNQVQAVIPFP